MKKVVLSALVLCCVVIAHAQSGLLDPSFGVNGIVITDVGSPYAYNNFGKQVLLQPDGSIYLVFDGASSLNGTVLIAKKHPDGSPDSSYGNNGFSVTAPVISPHAIMQPDGKIVVAGYT